MLIIWWPFAPKPERADTLEVTDLHSDAPPLYSTTFVVKVAFVFWLRLYRAGSFVATQKSPDMETDSALRANPPDLSGRVIGDQQ